MQIHYYWALLCNIKNFRKHEFFPHQISHSIFLNLIWRQIEISIFLLEYKIHAFASSKIKYLSLFSTVQSRKNSIRFGVVLEFIYEHHSVLTFNLCVFFRSEAPLWSCLSSITHFKFSTRLNHLTAWTFNVCYL